MRLEDPLVERAPIAPRRRPRYDRSGRETNPDREEIAIPTDNKAALLANAILEKKGADVVLLDVSELVGYADSFVIATGTSAPHLQAMTDAVVRAAAQAGTRPAGVEGRGGTSWVLIDCGDVLVHLFSVEARGFYDLDGLWCDAPREELSTDVEPAPRVTASV